MSHGKFGTAINCMDGRVQLPVINWMKQNFHLDYVDMITEPGPDKIMAGEQNPAIESIKARATISAKAHGSKIIVIAGHADCAGNPVETQKHQEQIKQSMRTIEKWNMPFEKVVGIFVNHDWVVEIVSTSGK